MRSEREINIFNISFLDLFCCALGAMIFVFILDTNTLTRNVDRAVQEYRSAAKRAEEAEENVRYAVEKYRTETEKARQAESRAIEERNRAEGLKNLAEEREKKLEETQKWAMEQEKEAKRDAAQAEAKRQELEKNLEEERQARKRSEKANDRMGKENAQLIEDNQKLRDMLKEYRLQEEDWKKLLSSYDRLDDENRKLKEELSALSEELDSARIANMKLQKDSERIASEQKRGRDELDRLEEDHSVLLAQNRLLQDQLKDKEKNVARLERELKEMQGDKRREAEKSLFGIKLRYNRIVFLFDSSGSIITNNWKEAIIATFREILVNCEVDEFAVVAFATDLYFFPGQGKTMAGSPENKQKAIKWLDSSLKFGGSTRMDLALKAAYERYEELDAIFLLTDGMPSSPNISSERLQEDIIAYIESRHKKGSPTKIITIAIGYPPGRGEQYKDIYNYLHRICELTGGQYLGR